MCYLNNSYGENRNYYSVIDYLHKTKPKIEQIIVAFPSMYIRCLMQAMMIKEDVGQCKGPSGICLKTI